MSFAIDSLALAQAAYQKALSAQTVQFGERRLSTHEIDKLLAQVKHWEREVSIEIARAAGRSSSGPLRFNL
jgi:HEPN domain-containing protein